MSAILKTLNIGVTSLSCTLLVPTILVLYRLCRENLTTYHVVYLLTLLDAVWPSV
jgi:hypothetical protein